MSNPQFKEMQDFFNKKGYLVIKGFLDKNVANLLYHYGITKTLRADFITMHAKDQYREKWEGEFGDEQIPNSYNCYGDPMMDTLLNMSTVSMENYIGIKLLPTYSYWRFYQFNDELHKHTDRTSCEISTTLCLGYDTSNVDKETYPSYSWPMFVEDLEGITTPVSLEPGDMIIYRGIELKHWREKYLGLNHAQVFLHYNDASNPDAELYDGRPILGIPGRYKAEK